MKKLVFFLFFTLLFACDKSSLQKAYNDYYKYQQKYISAILDKNKQKQIEILKKLIECGKFLKISIDKYKVQLEKLSQTNKTYKKSNAKARKTKYIKIISYSPIKIKIPDNKIKVFTIKNKNSYKKVFDIPNAIVAKFVKKNLNGITLRIAQFNKKTVRVVLSSNKKFKTNYQIKNNILIINTDNSKKPNITHSKKITPIVQKPKIYKKSKVIVIDPGHGGKDPGGVGLNKRYEKIAVLKISKYLKNYLVKKGYKVYLTRDKDIFIPLKKRTHFANLKKAD
ncbi:MAG TPA: N-acetylmuramoyl-L-alanine amidase, partial [Candidatus Atribacteria bacterium]|nr:N-acetylmuramoyl-L-alanine amidase [Candidatus Atribacteria bacterium]